MSILWEEVRTMPVTVLKIEGMTCDHCVRTIQAALLKVRDIRNAEVSLAEKKAVVTSGSALDLPEIFRAVAEEGYKASVIS
jgi:copper chaperone